MGKVVSAGDVYLCDFSQSTTGSMQSGLRPCIIVDNKMACAFSPCIHCVPLTTQTKKYRGQPKGCPLFFGSSDLNRCRY